MALAVQTSYPFDNQVISEDEWRSFARYFRSDGVIRNAANEFLCFGDSSGMQVKVKSGECWIQGQWGKNTTQVTLPVTAAHPTLARYDLAIIRNNFVANQIELDVLAGTPAVSPVLPTVTRNTSVWEIIIGYIVVGAGVVTITGAACFGLQEFTDGSGRYRVDSTEQAINTATITNVEFDLTEFDSSMIEKQEPLAYKIKRAGQWLAVVNLMWEYNATGTRFGWLARTTERDTDRLGFASCGGGITGIGAPLNFTATDRFALDDVISVYCYQNSGSTLHILNDFNATSISLFWLAE